MAGRKQPGGFNAWAGRASDGRVWDVLCVLIHFMHVTALYMQFVLPVCSVQGVGWRWRQVGIVRRRSRCKIRSLLRPWFLLTKLIRSNRFPVDWTRLHSTQLTKHPMPDNHVIHTTLELSLVQSCPPSAKKARPFCIHKRGSSRSSRPSSLIWVPLPLP